MIQVKCDQVGHQESPVSALCLKQDCKNNSACCMRCVKLHPDYSRSNISVVLKERFQPIDEYTSQPTLTNLNKLGQILKVQQPQDIQGLDNQKQDISMILDDFIKILLNQNEQKNTILSLDDQVKVPQLKIEGIELFKKGLYQEAIVAFDKAIQINKNDCDSWLWKGQSLYFQGKYSDSMYCFNQSIRIDPQKKDSYKFKGNALQQLNKHEEAIKCYDEQNKILPEIVCYKYKGSSIEKLSRLKEAEKCYQEGLMYFPDDQPLQDQLSAVQQRIPK